MMRIILAGLVIALTSAGSAFAQSNQRQSFGPWTLTTIVDQAGGPTRAILTQATTHGSGRSAGESTLTVRCRSDQPAKMDAIFSASQSLTSRPTHPIAFNFDRGAPLTQTWSSTDEYRGGLNGAAYNYNEADVSALLGRIEQSEQLTINSTTFTGASISVVFSSTTAHTRDAVQATMRACGRS